MPCVEIGPWTLLSGDDGEGLSLAYDSGEPISPWKGDEPGKRKKMVIPLVEDPELDELFKALTAWRALRGG